MLKNFIILSFLMFSFTFGFTEIDYAQTKTATKKASAKSLKPNSAPKIEAVNLSRSVIKIPCAEGQIPEETSCDSDSSVKISTLASDKDGDRLRYIYTVSEGRIIGEGAEVVWDLSGVKPGIYPLAVRVTDNRGGFQVKARQIEVKECQCMGRQCGYPCATNIAIDGTPETFNIGESLTFTVNFAAGTNEPTYLWEISGGEIVEGQGTPVIRVNTTGFSGQEITATVKLGGMDPACNNTASATVKVK